MSSNVVVSSNWGSGSSVQQLNDGTSNGALSVGQDRVGVGTTNPSQIMHLYGTDPILQIEGNSSDSYVRFKRGSDFWTVRHYGTNSLVIENSVSEKLTILTDGNVGIGTTSPASKLTVSGGASVGADYADDTAPTDGLIVKGNVGIGVTNPDSPLEIKKSVTAASGLAKGVNLEQTLTASASFDILTALHLKPTFNDNGQSCVAHRGLIVESGMVGIGTATPLNYQVEVYKISASLKGGLYVEANGDTEENWVIRAVAKGSNDYAIIADADNGKYGIKAITGNSSGIGGWFSGTSDGTALRTDTGNVLLCTSNGNVGIGTTSPATSAKLEIASTTGALLLSRMTTTQRDALTAVAGMVIFNTSTGTFQGCTVGGGTPTWVNL
jgi:hypothetical protein